MAVAWLTKKMKREVVTSGYQPESEKAETAARQPANSQTCHLVMVVA
jgi:hypothetical protein